MERPKPYTRLMEELCGSDRALISSVHHGLYETSLKGIYPLINLDDLVVFSASSWVLRKKNHDEFSKMLKDATLYEIFREAYRSKLNPSGLPGFVWLYNARHMHDCCEKYQRMNPFRKKDLRERLANVDESLVSKIKGGLSREVNTYVFECEYEARKYESGGDNSRLVLMHFQPAYQYKGQVVPKYAAEIARMLSVYPTNYELPEDPQLPLL